MTPSEKEKLCTSELTGVSLPLICPVFIVAQLAQQGLALYANSKFVEQVNIHSELQPELPRPLAPTWD